MQLRNSWTGVVTQEHSRGPLNRAWWAVWRYAKSYPIKWSFLWLWKLHLVYRCTKLSDLGGREEVVDLCTVLFISPPGFPSTMSARWGIIGEQKMWIIFPWGLSTKWRILCNLANNTRNVTQSWLLLACLLVLFYLFKKISILLFLVVM